MRALASTLLLLGCGRVGFDAGGAPPGDDAPRAGDAPLVVDGPTAPPDAACVPGPFGPPEALTAVNSAGGVDAGGWISDDGLWVVFSSTRGGAGGADLFETRRASLTEAFATPTPLATLNTAIDDDNPIASADGLTLWFDRGEVLQRATRAAVDVAFGASTVADLTPLGDEFAIDLSADELTLVGSAERVLGEGDLDVYVTRRAASTVAFPASSPQPSINTAAFECCPTLAPDGQALLYTSATVGPGAFGLAVAAWDGSAFIADGAFTASQATAADRTYDAHWARSGRFVIFTSNRDGDDDLYLLTAPCE